MDEDVSGKKQGPTRCDQPERQIGIVQRGQGVVLVEWPGGLESLPLEQEAGTAHAQAPVPELRIRGVEARREFGQLLGRLVAGRHGLAVNAVGRRSHRPDGGVAVERVEQNRQVAGGHRDPGAEEQDVLTLRRADTEVERRTRAQMALVGDEHAIDLRLEPARNCAVWIDIDDDQLEGSGGGVPVDRGDTCLDLVKAAVSYQNNARASIAHRAA